MTLDIDSSVGKILYFPDVSNNLELPEKDRFGFELNHVSDFQINASARSLVATKDGIKANSLDVNEYIRLHIKQILNPPTLKIDGDKEEDMKIKHLFEFAQFEEIKDDLFIEISKIRKVSGLKKN